MIFTVSIDGPAAAGKGTIGRAVAERFGFRYVDTRLFYPAVAMKGGNLAQAAWTLTPADLARNDLRSAKAQAAAAQIAAIPAVQAGVHSAKRDCTRLWGGAVVTGCGDIGTEICPEAEVKFYITANSKVRAHRQGLATGGDQPQHRQTDVPTPPAKETLPPSPAAQDAVVIDTTDLTIAEAVETACAVVKARLQPAGRIILRRPGGWQLGYFRAYRIFVDGVLRGSLRPGTNLTVPHAPGRAVIEAKIGYAAHPAMVMVATDQDCVVEVADALGIKALWNLVSILRPILRRRYLRVTQVSGAPLQPRRR